MTDSDLIQRLEAGKGEDNALDVLVDIALFEPDENFTAIRANSAGTKIICSAPDGADCTFWAYHYTRDRPSAIAALRARGTS